MHLFNDYLQPLTTWIYANPHWALVITFLISFAESLAVIGSIVPGSVTMTAIGILAGSGVMRIDLTLLAATLGAVAGDGASYMLGYTFRHSIPNIWPFRTNPNWLIYGKDYFAKHGGKSVLIGRFIGPLRAVIPVIAGMMHMNRFQFLGANIVSAIGWSLVYVLPGILIGAASTELSAENASRLFVLILVLLILTWLMTRGIKWALFRIQAFLEDRLNRYWLKGLQSSRFKACMNYLTPGNETNHYATAGLILLFFITLLMSLFICGFVIHSELISGINHSTYLFLQTLQTKYFDAFFIAISLFINPLSLFSLYFAIALYLVFHKDWRTLSYWVSMAFFTSILVYALNLSVPVPQPNGSYILEGQLYFPSIDLTYASALFGFLIFYISTKYRTTITLTIRILLLTILFLTGLGAIYLTTNWITGVVGAYCIGLTICLGHWIFYRRKAQWSRRSQLPIVFSCLVLLIMTVISNLLYFRAIVEAQRPYYKQYVITEGAWWNQTKPLLPLYMTNRIGQNRGSFNVQVVGDIDNLKKNLINAGWKQQPSSFFYSLLERVSNDSEEEDLPVIEVLYNNYRPYLIMSYKQNKTSPMIVLRFWRSNFHIQGYRSPISIGNIQTHKKKKDKYFMSASNYSAGELKLIQRSLPEYRFKHIDFKRYATYQNPKQTKQELSNILLIKTNE
jgi:membrane protein DedA with SNARE-associated domain